MSLSPIFAAAGGIACLAALSYALPSAVVVERSAVIDADPAAVFALLDGAASFQTINPWKDADPDLAISFSGPDRGVGSAFAFKGADGEGVQTIVATEPERLVVTEVDLGPMGEPVRSFTLVPTEGGVKLTWRTEAAFGLNPIGRIMGLFMDGRLGPVYERGLTNIANAV